MSPVGECHQMQREETEDRLPPGTGPCGNHSLFDAQAGDRAGDHQLLDLGSSLEDGVDLCVIVFDHFA